MNFIKENGITVATFAQKVAHIPRANVSLYFNSPPRWSKANQPLKTALINVSFWLDLENSDRLKILDDSLEIQEVQTSSSNEENEDFDTTKISQKMKIELRRTGTTVKSFAQMVSVNRNYLANMINTPIPWNKTTALQRKVYKHMESWMRSRNMGFQDTPNPSRMALKPINGLVSKPEFKKKQVRVRFSDEQRKYLLDKFAKNPRPSPEERLEMCKYLGVNMRTVVIFFSNRRSRLIQNSPSTPCVELE